MTEEEYTTLEKYCDKAKDVMGLTCERIIIHRDAPETEDAIAETAITPGRHVIVLRFCYNFPELPKEDQRETIIHELLHNHYNRMYYFALDEYEKCAGQSQYELYQRSIVDLYELGTDRLAHALSKAIDLRKLPYIKWPSNDNQMEIEIK